MLDPKFVHVQNEYLRLRERHDGGQITNEQFEAALQGLIFEHEGWKWTIGATSGKWFASNGGTWVEAKPPQSGPDLPEHATTPGHGTRPPTNASAPPNATAPSTEITGGAGKLIGWGTVLLFVGAVSFVLPLIGMQFRLLSLFGEENETAAAIIMIVLGGILILVGRAAGTSKGPP